MDVPSFILHLGFTSNQGAFILMTGYDLFLNSAQKITNDLIKYAESGKHVNFRLLRTWQEYFAIRRRRRAIGIIIKSLTTSRRKLLDRYCKDIPGQKTDFIKLLAYKALGDTLDFYIEEHRILSDMIDEYDFYILDGNFGDFILYGGRPNNKLWDHRRS